MSEPLETPGPSPYARVDIPEKAAKPAAGWTPEAVHAVTAELTREWSLRMADALEAEVRALRNPRPTLADVTPAANKKEGMCEMSWVDQDEFENGMLNEREAIATWLTIKRTQPSVSSTQLAAEIREGKHREGSISDATSRRRKRRILDELRKLYRPNNWTHVRIIAREAGLGEMRVRVDLRELCAAGLVEENPTFRDNYTIKPPAPSPKPEPLQAPGLDGQVARLMERVSEMENVAKSLAVLLGAIGDLKTRVDNVADCVGNLSERVTTLEGKGEA